MLLPWKNEVGAVLYEVHLFAQCPLRRKPLRQVTKREDFLITKPL